MSLFLRRNLQCYLDSLQGSIPQNHLRKLVNALNGGSNHPLGFEWELVFLWGLSQLFRVEYEPLPPNGPQIDFVVYPFDETRPLFSAEMKCVSDRSREEENDVGRFVTIIQAACQKVAWKGRVDYHVDGKVKHHGGGEPDESSGADDEFFERGRMTLTLPATEEEWKETELRIERFLATAAPQDCSTLSLSDIAEGLTISVEPGRGIGGGFPDYTATYSVTKNPVASALSGKRREMSRIQPPPEGPVGILLCDGGCSLLRQTGYVPNGVSLKRVVTSFLENSSNKLVDFVGVFGIESKYKTFMNQNESHRIVPQIFSKQSSAVSAKVVADALNTVTTKVLPRTECSAQNASNFYLYGEGRRPWRFQSTILRGDSSMSMSTRLLMKIISEHFERETDQAKQNGGAPRVDPFARKLQDGRLPVAAKIIKHEDMDDDEIVFEFGEQDAASGKFRMPLSGG